MNIDSYYFCIFPPKPLSESGFGKVGSLLSTTSKALPFLFEISYFMSDVPEMDINFVRGCVWLFSTLQMNSVMPVFSLPPLMTLYVIKTLCFTALALVSLESAERPNYFLYVHDNDSLGLLMWQASSAFHQRATFFHHQGLWIPGASAFELYSKKGFFIVFTDSSVRVSKYEDSDEFKRSSSFSIEGGLPGSSNEREQTRVPCRPCQMPMLRIWFYEHTYMTLTLRPIRLLS